MLCPTQVLFYTFVIHAPSKFRLPSRRQIETSCLYRGTRAIVTSCVVSTASGRAFSAQPRPTPSAIKGSQAL